MSPGKKTTTRQWFKPERTWNTLYKNNAYYPPNGKIDEDNIAYVADVAAKSIADLAFVSIASPETPWKTLRIDEDTTGISLDSVIDYLTNVDDKTKSWSREY